MIFILISIYSLDTNLKRQWRVRSSFCNLWVAGSNPAPSVSVPMLLGKTLPAGGTDCMAVCIKVNCGYNVGCCHQHLKGLKTEFSEQHIMGLWTR